MAIKLSVYFLERGDRWATVCLESRLEVAHPRVT